MYDMSISTDTTQTPWIPTTDDFDARLALIRQRMGWNLAEAAEACGLKESNWREWELKGRRPHDLQGVCDKISAAAHGVEVYWLMTGRRNGIFPNRPGGGTEARTADYGSVDSRHLATVTVLAA